MTVQLGDANHVVVQLALWSPVAEQYYEQMKKASDDAGDAVVRLHWPGIEVIKVCVRVRCQFLSFTRRSSLSSRFPSPGTFTLCPNQILT